MNNPVNVFLGGKLGQLFGKKWTLYVSSPAEALRAIDVNLGGKLKEYLSTKGTKKYYKVAIQKKENLLTADEIKNKSGSGDIYVMPAVRGAGGNSALQIIIGAALIGLTFGLATPGVFGTAALIGKTAATIGYGLGASLILGGVMSLLTPKPTASEQDSRQSSTFAGNATTVSQGSSVGLVYGRALVSPMPISLSFNNYPQKITTQTDIENPTRVDLPDGGFYYV